MNHDPRPEAAPSGVLTRRAYTYVADRIITGALSEGEFLTEGALATELGMSRTPVREALLLAETRGLLRLVPKKGAIVSSVSDKDLASLLDVRVMLESEAVRLIGHLSDKHDVLEADLAEILAHQSSASHARDVRSFAVADHQFHARIIQESGNSIIKDFYVQLGPRLERFVHRVAARDVDLLDRLVGEHQQLLELIRRHDSESFERALRDHVTGSRR